MVGIRRVHVGVRQNERFLRRGSRFHRAYNKWSGIGVGAIVSRLTAVKAGRTRFRFHPRLKLYANREATLNYPPRYRSINVHRHVRIERF